MLVKLFLIVTILIVGCSYVGGKTGACPPMDPNEVGSCGYMCIKDSKCDGDRLCCKTTCGRGGTRCELPDYSLVRKPGRCPPGPPSATCTQLCRHDGDCASTTKCCKTSCGTSCLPPDNSTIVKPGVCTTPAPDSVGLCYFPCYYDAQCPGDQKCCRNACGGTVCQTVAVATFAKKLGTCPSPSSKNICTAICNNDYACPDLLKCCPTACAGGFVCSRPIL